jgi:hypothetical protein
MAVHNIPARVHKTRTQLKTEAEIIRPSSKNESIDIITYINQFFGHSPLDFKRFDEARV